MILKSAGEGDWQTMIKLQQDEYEHLLIEIHSIHETVMQQMTNYISELNELIIPKGGFHADLISEKVKLLLQSFENDVFPQLESTFNETEKSIKMFGDRLNDLDESGRTKVVWEDMTIYKEVWNKAAEWEWML